MPPPVIVSIERDALDGLSYNNYSNFLPIILSSQMQLLAGSDLRKW